MKASVGGVLLIAGLGLGATGCGEGEFPTAATQEQPVVMAAAKGAAKVGAIVGGHWEGPPGGHGEVHVTINSVTETYPFSTTSGETHVVIPPNLTQFATVTILISDQETGGLVTAVDQFSDAADLCEDMPVLDVTGFTPCAHPDYLVGPVKRFNLMINSSAGGPFDDRRGGNPDDGTAN